MSFLNQLKSQAQNAAAVQTQTRTDIEANTRQTELACKTVWHYVSELCKTLNVLAPPAPEFALDKNAVWPPMKLHDFRADSRKKMLRDQEVVDTISMGWQIIPVNGKPGIGTVEVDFVPALERVEKNLHAGGVKFERKDVVQTDKRPRRVIRFEYVTQARGYISITPDHDNAQIAFRLANTSGFGVKNVVWPASRMQTDFLDELAKLIVAQPSQFVPAVLE
ncbi:MAG: hypothetical protein CFE44_12280 [Burkholderiales bacterium PBB4]|nr:MAG: hypothetical protein CFE44_12280 [Burkholderiales bacterium PBB4]